MEVSIVNFSKERRASSFDCGEEELNDFFLTKASQYIKKNFSRVYTLINTEDQTSIGFYSLSAGHIELKELPINMMKHLPHPIVPIIRVGRLAVAKPLQSKGLGRHMMLDAINKCLKISSEVGVFGMIVDSKNEKVKKFYFKLGFQELISRPQTLILQLSRMDKVVKAMNI